MLFRSRLVDQLCARWVSRLTVVSAAAGYGKTTLLVQALAANADSPTGIDCWVAWRRSSAMPLADAICRSVGAPPPAPSSSAEDVVAAIVDAIWREAPRQVSLVLDDVDDIRPGTSEAAVLAAIVESLPGNGHLVLAGRSLPPLELARHEVEGQLVFIDQSEMAFTDEEVTEFAALRQVAPDRLVGCGGWPALVELAAARRTVVGGQYVEQEVVRSWPAWRRRALALLAHVDWFDEEIAATVLEAPLDLDGLLAGVPLVNEVVEVGRCRWSLHGLWRTWLAREVESAEIAAARRRAGEMMLGRGDAVHALPHLIDAGAWDQVAKAIVRALGAADPPVHRDVLAGWLLRLPRELRDAPAGQLLATMAAPSGGDPVEITRRLERAAQGFRDAGDVDGELACLVQLGLRAWWTDDPDWLSHLATRVFELEAGGCAAAVPLACIGRALVHDIVGDSQQVLAELDRIPSGSLGQVLQGIVSWIRSMSLLQLGDAAAALDSADTAWSLAGALYPSVAGARLQALWHLGRTAEAVEALPATYEDIKRFGSDLHVALAAGQCSMVHAHLGQLDLATRFLAEARQSAARSADGPLVEACLRLAEATAAVLAGDEAGAATTLTAYLQDHPLDQGIDAGFHRRHLALLYVLVPSTRPHWDGATLGPTWLFARDLAQAVVAVRAGQDLPPATNLKRIDLAQAHLPPPWLAELGIAAIAAGRDEGWQILDRTWPTTREAVANLAQQRRAHGLRSAAREALGRLPVPPGRRLSLQVLGPIQLHADGEPVAHPAWRRDRVRLLLAYLALHKLASRGQVAEDLWPSLDLRAQAGNLRVTLTYLLRVLEPRRGVRDPSFFIRQEGGNLALHAGGWLEVDLWKFDAIAAQATQAQREGAPARVILDLALAACDLWSDMPTDLASEEWAVGQFEQRQQSFGSLATRAGELLLARGEIERARALAERALRIDPWQEGAHRLILAAHCAAGDALAARRSIEDYRSRLDDLGLGVDEETRMVERLVESIPAITVPPDRLGSGLDPRRPGGRSMRGERQPAR